METNFNFNFFFTFVNPPVTNNKSVPLPSSFAHTLNLILPAPVPQVGHSQRRESQGKVWDVHRLSGEYQPGRQDGREPGGISR